MDGKLLRRSIFTAIFARRDGCNHGALHLEETER